MKVFCHYIPFSGSEKIFSAFSPAYTDIWILQIPEEGWDNSPLYNMMYPDEQLKAQKFYRRQDTNQYILAHGGLRCILSRYIGIHPRKIHFLYNEKGKPYLPSGYLIPLEFNISHSHGFVVIAISTQPIGVDVEYVSRSFNYVHLLRTCFTDREIERIKGNDKPLLQFFELWTRKESLLKALGIGLNNSLNQISCMDGEQDMDLHIGEEMGSWFIKSVVPHPDIILSICQSENNSQFRFFKNPSQTFLKAWSS